MVASFQNSRDFTRCGCSEIDLLLYIFAFINVKKLLFIRGIVVKG